MVIPGTGGRKTFNALRAVNPDIKILLASGYGVNGEAQQLLSERCSGFIQNPFRIQELSKKIRDVL
jgi:two-component system cell cycle sensor histidine kinase/response regulator CckA